MQAELVAEKRNAKFQSTPPVAEGRCLRGVDADEARRGFNPRPPLPRGDAGYVGMSASARLVSIHAPRCRGAMRVLEVVA